MNTQGLLNRLRGIQGQVPSGMGTRQRLHALIRDIESHGVQATHDEGYYAEKAAKLERENDQLAERLKDAERDRDAWRELCDREHAHVQEKAHQIVKLEEGGSYFEEQWRNACDKNGALSHENARLKDDINRLSEQLLEARGGEKDAIVGDDGCDTDWRPLTRSMDGEPEDEGPTDVGGVGLPPIPESADAMAWAEVMAAYLTRYGGATDPGYLVGWLANYRAACEQDDRKRLRNEVRKDIERLWLGVSDV